MSEDAVTYQSPHPEPEKFAAFVWIENGTLYVQPSGPDFFLLKQLHPELERQWVENAKARGAAGVFGMLDNVCLQYVFSDSYPQELPINLGGMGKRDPVKYITRKREKNGRS